MNLFNVYPLFDVEPVKGKGCQIFDKNGTAYLDMYSGHGVISVGHSHPKYISKLSAQIQNLTFYSNSVQNPLQKEFATKLGLVSGCDDYELFLCNSGAEANENALKLASFQTNKKKVIAFQKGFHGRTSAAVNVTDNPKIKAPLNLGFPVELLPFNDIVAVEKALLKGDAAAVIIEAVQGIGGINLATKEFLTQVQFLCQKHGAVLILDEVQAGYGRTGKFFTFQHSDIQPDLITMAKGMGNGFPIGGVLIHPKFEATYGLLGHTFGGNHLACTAGIAVLEIMESEKLMDNSTKIGAYLLEELSKISEIKEVRGKGLMIGIELDFAIKRLRNMLLYDEKIFTGSSSNPNVLRLLPPLCLSQNEANLFLKKFKKQLAIITTKL
ncbi:MAG: aminotransferase class III-fold pyridoxal phosphate-dependent enzyme [Saprospiraceae bacterium]|jgi:acetylornithine aminotransferase|nr:aminotransferase class III-fold pyridoxal phosphate-dependent enzyme [Saprospiraceae bacterium]